ncbi:MAG: hypothetical protein IPI23_17575 [Bacteroidetes bacterium]|nr:hypothetical protein [Bacteroidota bacterium]
MKIAVNTRLLLPGKLDGMGWFAWHTLRRMTANHPETEFIFFFDRPWSDEFFGKNVTRLHYSLRRGHPFVLLVVRRLHSGSTENTVDVFYSPDGYLSLSNQRTTGGCNSRFEL